jgi:hypothetical protein
MPPSAPKSLLILLTALTLLFAAPAAAQAYWGSIAVDPETGAYGVSSEEPTAKAAQRKARSVCGSPGCRVAAWVSNGFAALVLKKNGIYYAGIGRTENLARKHARMHALDSGARYITSVFSGLS